MNDDLDGFFADSEPVSETPAEAQAPEPEPAPEQAEPAPEPAEPDPEKLEPEPQASNAPPPGYVPAGVVKGLRERLKAEQEARAAYEAAYGPPSAADVFEAEAPMQPEPQTQGDVLFLARLHADAAATAAAVGEERVDAAVKAFNEAVQRGEATPSMISGAWRPAAAIVKWHEQRERSQAVSNDDEWAQFQEWKASRASPQAAAPPAKAASPPPPIRSVSKAPSAGLPASAPAARTTDDVWAELS